MPSDERNPDVDAFIDALWKFRAGLSSREQELLLRVLFSAMDPLERVLWDDATAPLTAHELEQLRDLPDV